MAKWGEDRFGKLQEARATVGAKRLGLAAQLKEAAARQAERLAAEQAKTKRFDDIDIDAALAFAAAIPLRRFDLAFEGTGTLNRPSLQLLRQFLAALVDQKSAAILQWPAAQRDAAILHPLAMLAMLGSRAAIVTGQHRWCPAVHDMRTLYFPWRGGGTGSDQRGWLVDRDKIIAPNALHRTRGLAGEQEATVPLGMLHDTLGHLKRRPPPPPFDAGSTTPPAPAGVHLAAVPRPLRQRCTPAWAGTAPPARCAAWQRGPAHAGDGGPLPRSREQSIRPLWCHRTPRW
ncbi:hypothetical protein ACBY01_16010 [Sphingomonas sp. ac-8]|uniref:hypothetical protein n=1 Tax=Sphingomonas sp. ac-8 TaxID=3242977 RepID=UPI003A7FA7FD